MVELELAFEFGLLLAQLLILAIDVVVSSSPIKDVF